MAGTLLIGAAPVLGVAMWAAAIGECVLLGALWLSSLPLQQHPFADEHLIYAVALRVLALTDAGRVGGLGRFRDARKVRTSWTIGPVSAEYSPGDICPCADHVSGNGRVEGDTYSANSQNAVTSAPVHGQETVRVQKYRRIHLGSASE